MAKREVELVFKVRDLATNALRGLGNQLLGVGTALLGIRSVTRSLTTAIRDFGTEERSIRRLEATLANMGETSIDVRDDLIKFAAEIQRTTTVTDDQIISIQGLLVGYGL